MDASPASVTDPTAPLPGPPDPWTSTDIPSRRAGPPYHMTDMIAAEPGLAVRLLGRLAAPDGAAARLAAAVREAASAGRAVVTTGCGTSEHGALAAADILRDALTRAGLPTGPTSPAAIQAFELALAPPSSGLVIGISHEGGTAATLRALAASAAAGARVGLVTVSGRSPAAALAEPGLVLETDELDQSWCHTVGYVSPILAATAIAGHLTGTAADPEVAAATLAGGAAEVAAIEAVAGSLAGCARIVVVASGADRTAGRELVLKLEEGTWIPSAYRDLETVLHGHWPGTDRSAGLVLMLADRERRDDRLDRARQALAAARAIGLASGAIVARGAASALPDGSTPAGRIVVPEAPDLTAPTAALLATATALQLLTERLARALGRDPDPIRRDDPAYAAAGVAAEG
jgi:fructoselysine-6-P-deglycase FrlB-like protein